VFAESAGASMYGDEGTESVGERKGILGFMFCVRVEGEGQRVEAREDRCL